MQGVAEQLVEPGLEGSAAGQVQEMPVGGVHDPGRGVDRLGAQGGGAGPGVVAAGEGGGGVGEVVGDRGADQPDTPVLRLTS